MKTNVTQRYTRYFFLLNLFGFFFVSATALAATELEEKDGCNGACIFSCGEAPAGSSAGTGSSFALQPILGAAVAHEASDEVVVVPAIDSAAAQHSSVDVLSVAPKQSPPAFA